MDDQATRVSRRSFFTLLGTGAATIAGLGLAGCSAGSPQSDSRDYLPTSWDAEADIVIVGHGGAGAAAAIACVNENLGSIYLMDAAPEGQDGGNTKVSMNLMLIPKDANGAVIYQRALNGPHTVDDELIRGWASNLCENETWLSELGIDLKQSTAFSPEFPEVESSDSVRTFLADGISGNNSLWKNLTDQENYLSIPINYDTQATTLIRDPVANEVLGVVADQAGKTINIKAKKGVILSCGGFENNPDMCHDYLGLGQSKHPLGTPFNRGDGFKMIEPFGARLWHMNNSAGAMVCVAGSGIDSPSATGTSFGNAAFPLHSYIFVGPDAKRYIYEETCGNTRHGKINQGGVYVDLPVPEGGWIVFDQTIFDQSPIATPHKNKVGWTSNVEGGYIASDNGGYLDAGVIVKGDTVADLAQATGLPADILGKTIERYNSSAASGSDPEFNRGQAVYSSIAPMGHDGLSNSAEEQKVVEEFTLVPLSGTLYATPLRGCVYNTQGGPKRNANGQVLGFDDQPIGRLYAAGEFGAIYSYMYNGGGNVSDALASGRAAARHASSLDEWE